MAYDRLADAIIKHAKLILVAWIVILLVAAVPAINAFSNMSYDMNEMGIDESESMKGLEIIGTYFPSSDADASALPMLVVGYDDAEEHDQALTIVSALQEKRGEFFVYTDKDGTIHEKISSISAMMDTGVTNDPETGDETIVPGILVLSLSYSSDWTGNVIDDTPVLRDQIAAALADYETENNTEFTLSTYLTGNPAVSYDMENGAMEDISHIDIFTVLMILILVGLFFRSFITSAMPPVTMGVAFAVTMGLIYGLMYFMDIFFITEIMLPGGQMTKAVVIRSDGNMEPDPGIRPPAAVTKKEELAQAARAAGLVGLGGAGFPAHVKLNTPEGTKIDTLLVNAAECEPYVTSDHREALENGRNVLEGVYHVKEILGVQRVIIAVEDNKPDVIQKLSEIADDPKRDPLDLVRVRPLKSRYPHGAVTVRVQACTGRKVPAGKLPADVGCLVMNIGSLSFLASYMRTGMPLTLKRVTLDGSAIAHPQNVIVPVGTPIKDVVAFCGGYKAEPKKLIMGGPMMGVAITSDELPILKQNNAILAFDQREAQLRQPTACIRCGRCVAACPMHLMPTKLEQAVERQDVEALQSLDIMTCMECGCCSFSCPAGRRLVQAIRLGKNYVRKAGGKK